MRAFAVVPLFLMWAVVLVSCTSDSDPSQIFLCDARSDRWGCKPSDWINGNRLKCSNATRIMWWASETVPSNCYRLVAGLDETNPDTSYTPEEILQLQLRVTCWKKEYRGLLVYAVDSNENKVGEWELPYDEPATFVLPYTSGICQNSLMHASAELKPYHAILRFKAPPTGTGTITFRALIKQGDANTGAFYWPNNGVDLTLSEGAIGGGIPWIKSADGQSCNEACAAIGQGCVQNDLLSLNTAEVLLEQVGGHHACNYPILSGCGTDGASFDSAYDFCYFADQTCAAQNRSPSVVSCATKSAGTSRFCSCSAALPPVTSTSSGTVDEDVESSASRFSFGILVAVLLAPFLLFGNGRTSTAVFVMALLASSAYGHNWIHSNSRSVGASTNAPCPPSSSPLPQAQVGPDQSFQIEWMNGHGSTTYFAIVHSRDIDKLNLHNQNLLEDYIAKAPAGTINRAQTPGYQRLFRKTIAGLDLELPESTVPNYFLKEVMPTDPEFIARPAEFTSTVAGVADENLHLMAYKPADIADDVRVSYQSTEYPWIEAVYKFKITATHPGRPDTTRFFIPGFGGEGRYIVQWLWRGYRDCTDVDYKTTPVAEVYGHPPTETIWNRIDHCLFESPVQIYEHSEVVTDPQWCLNRCAARGNNCWGVNVVPLMAPSTSYTFPDPTNNTWVFPNIRGSDIYVPWNHGAFGSTRDQFAAKASPDKFMCYTLRPRVPTDTQSDITTSNDPTNPIFYSTCYYRFLGMIFDDYEDNFIPAAMDVGWRFNTKCIDCDLKAANEFFDVVPKWELADTCINCQKEPSTVPEPLFPDPIVVASGVCDGYPNNPRATHHDCVEPPICYKRLNPLGRPVSQPVTRQECAILTAQDTGCSSKYFFRNDTNACWCYTNEPCCKTCSRKNYANHNVYEVSTTPDPTCSTGILSEDGSACCSGTCGAGNCVITAGSTQDAEGFCLTTSIPAARTCSSHSPPCRL